MRLKHGSTTTEHLNNNQFDLITYWCLTLEQQALGREPFSTLKSVLVEHMQEHFPGQNFNRPSGQLNIEIPLQFHTEVFCNYYDELAYQLATYHKENQSTWTKQGMKDLLKKYPLPAGELKQGNNVPGTIFEKTIALDDQVHLPNKLLKKDFKPNKSNSLGGRSNPDMVFFPRKKTPTDTKMAILKESSETNILLSKLITEKEDGNKLPMNICLLLNQQLGPNRDTCTTDQLYDAFHGVSWAVNAQVYNRIHVFSPAINAYLNLNPNAPAEYKESRKQALDDRFKYVIKKERTQAAIAGIFNRILMGPAAPKIKFIYDESSPNHLKLLSRKLPNSEDYLSVCENKPETAYATAPDLAAAAIVRLILGCDDMEMRLNNFMCVSIGNQKKLVNIDTDYSFVEQDQNKLKDLTLDIEGAKNLCSNRPRNGSSIDDHKQFWDQIFSRTDNAAVQKSMLEMLQRAAAVLTDEMINHVVDYVVNQEHEVFSVVDSDKAQLVEFLKKSRTLVIDKLKALNAYNEHQNPIDAARWVKDIFEDMQTRDTTLTM